MKQDHEPTWTWSSSVTGSLVLVDLSTIRFLFTATRGFALGSSGYTKRGWEMKWKSYWLSNSSLLNTSQQSYCHRRKKVTCHGPCVFLISQDFHGLANALKRFALTNDSLCSYVHKSNIATSLTKHKKHWGMWRFSELINIDFSLFYYPAEHLVFCWALFETWQSYGW